MSERRRARAGLPGEQGSDGPPRWLFAFEFGAWVKGATPDSPDPGRATPRNAREMVAYSGARRRWAEARREWLRLNGRVMSGVYPETYTAYEQIADREPARVVTPDWAAESADFREYSTLRLAWGDSPDMGRVETVVEADFDLYASPDLEED